MRRIGQLVTALAVLLAGSAVVSPAGAEVLGRRHIGIGVGATWVGDDYVDGTGLDFNARIRLPVGRHFDVVAFHGQSMFEGSDSSAEGAPYVKLKNTEYGVDLICHVLPKRTVDPFLSVGVSNAATQTTIDGRPTYADEDVKFKFGGGAEINLRKNISLGFGVAYQDSFDEPRSSDATAGISVDGWVSDVLLVGAGVDGSFDTGDTSASFRVAYGF